MELIMIDNLKRTTALVKLAVPTLWRDDGVSLGSLYLQGARYLEETAKSVKKKKNVPTRSVS